MIARNIYTCFFLVGFCCNLKETNPHTTYLKHKEELFLKVYLYNCRKIFFAPIKLDRRLKQKVHIHE